MTSCVFCYFAGMWIIASRFGLFKILMRYGVTEIFDEIPKSFPQMKYLYIAFAVYTLLFAIVTYIIYKVVSRQEEDHRILQQQVSEVANFANQVADLQTLYARFAKVNNIPDTVGELKLKMLQHQIAALPPAIVRNPTMKSNLASIISEINDFISPDFDYRTFCCMLDSAIDTVNSLKRKTVNINN